MKKYLSILLLVFAASALWAEEIKWLSFNKGLEKAKKEKKPMLVSVESPYCHWCQVMSEKTYGNKEVIRKVNKKFAAVKIDVTNMNYHLNFEGKRYSAEEFLGMIGIQGTPTTLFLDQNGKFLTKIPGFVPPETYLSLLDYFYQSCYSQNMSFQDFMDKPGKCKKSSSK